MKKLFVLIAFLFALSAPGLAQQPLPPGSTPVAQSQTMLNAATAAVHSHTSAATLTITVPAGQVAYITGIDLGQCQNTAITPAAPLFITTTGLAGAPQYIVGTGSATAGLCSPMSIMAFSTPLKSQTPGTNVT